MIEVNAALCLLMSYQTYHLLSELRRTRRRKTCASCPRASLCFFAKLLCMKPQRCNLTAKRRNSEKKIKPSVNSFCQDQSSANTFQAKQQNNNTMQLNTLSYLPLIRSFPHISLHVAARHTISSIVIIRSDL